MTARRSGRSSRQRRAAAAPTTRKLFVVRRKDRPEEDVAFVGGIDLCHGRRDDAEHHGDPQAPPLDERYGATPPWHDAMAEIRGPAVAHVLDTFAERWDDGTPLDHRNPYRAVLHRLARMPRHPERLPELWDPPPEIGTHQVQILRTYPAKRPAYPFAPDGERTIARGYSRAFERARRLIYIEDQYFWSDVVATALADALRREPDLTVIAVVPRFPEEDNRLGGPPMFHGQRLAWEALHEAGGDRFAMFDLENAAGTPIYVTSRTRAVVVPTSPERMRSAERTPVRVLPRTNARAALPCPASRWPLSPVGGTVCSPPW